MKIDMNTTLAILIIGTNTYDDYTEFCYIINHSLKSFIEKNNNILIIGSKMEGICKLTKKYAKENLLTYKEFVTHEDIGTLSNYINNAKMQYYISNFKNRICICFLNEYSKEITYNLELAYAYNTKIKLYDYKRKRFIQSENYFSYKV